jgi:hypothetical protein
MMIHGPCFCNVLLNVISHWESNYPPPPVITLNLQTNSCGSIHFLPPFLQRFLCLLLLHSSMSAASSMMGKRESIHNTTRPFLQTNLDKLVMYSSLLKKQKKSLYSCEGIWYIYSEMERLCVCKRYERVSSYGY